MTMWLSERQSACLRITMRSARLLAQRARTPEAYLFRPVKQALKGLIKSLS